MARDSPRSSRAASARPSKSWIVGSDRWKADPSLVGDAIADALRWTLAFLVTMDGTRAGWAFALLTTVGDEARGGQPGGGTAAVNLRRDRNRARSR
jgi:hypothetical protein